MMTIRELQAMYKLTEKERVLWQIVFDFCMDKGYSPSLQELSEKLELATSTVSRRLKNMRRKGYVYWPEGAKRAMRCYPIIDEGMDNDHHPGTDSWKKK